MAEESEIRWVDVLSSRCTRVGYDAESQTLFVQWNRGKTSAYGGVPPDIAEECSKSWSTGEYLNANIIGKYPMQYI